MARAAPKGAARPAWRRADATFFLGGSPYPLLTSLQEGAGRAKNLYPSQSKNVCLSPPSEAIFARALRCVPFRDPLREGGEEHAAMACLGSATPTPEWLTARAGAWGAGSASTEDEGAAPSTTRVGGDFGAAAEADAATYLYCDDERSYNDDEQGHYTGGKRPPTRSPTPSATGWPTRGSRAGRRRSCS